MESGNVRLLAKVIMVVIMIFTRNRHRRKGLWKADGNPMRVSGSLHEGRGTYAKGRIRYLLRGAPGVW